MVRRNSCVLLQAWHTIIIYYKAQGWLVGAAQGQHRPQSSWWTCTSYARLFPPNRSGVEREEILLPLSDIQKDISRYS
jgi:hypothetical protein